MTTSSDQEWEYWRKVKSFQLFQGMSLRRGYLPCRNLEWLSHEEGHALHHEINTMANFEEDFLLLLGSIRSDSLLGAEFRKLNNEQAARAQIPKETFLEHCRKCGLTIQRKLVSETRGRPMTVPNELLLGIAKTCAEEERDYEAFLSEAEKKMGRNRSKTIKNKLPKKHYLELVKSSRK